MVVEERLSVARDLIQSKQYDAAKALLRTLPDNVTAQSWLAKLGTLAPEIQPVSASEDRHRVQQWEYCAIGPIRRLHQNSGLEASDPLLIFFTKDGPRVEVIEGGGRFKLDTGVPLVQLVAQLGNDSWEMIGTGYASSMAAVTGADGHILYFKRPKR